MWEMCITPCFSTVSVFTEEMYPSKPIRRLDHNGYMACRLEYTTPEFKTRVTQLVWTTVIFYPTETFSEFLIPKAFQMFNSQWKNQEAALPSNTRSVTNIVIVLQTHRGATCCFIYCKITPDQLLMCQSPTSIWAVLLRIKGFMIIL